MLRPEEASGAHLDVRDSRGRLVLGMPGRVWTMALWFGAISILLAVSLLVPLDATARPALRAALMIYAFFVVVLLLVLRQQVTTWLIHVQVGVGIAASLLLVGASGTPVGAITSANSLIVVAAYVGFWLSRKVALGYVCVFSAGLLAVFGLGGNLPSLLIPWILLCTLSFGIVLSFGTLVRQLNAQLVTDPLTGLLNRTGMFAMIETRGGPERLPRPLSLMVIDLDDFKSINDRQGHLAGDRILRTFGEALRSAIRPGDIAIRSGGDEFVVLLPHTDVAGADGFAVRLQGAMALPWSHGATEWTPGEAFDTAWARADLQMYTDKARRSAT